MKRVFNISIWSICTVGIIGLLSFTEQKNEALFCKKINVHIDRINKNFFVLEEDVLETVNNLGYAEGMILSEIDAEYIEKILTNNASIASADVYKTIDGVVNIELKERNPIMRVVPENGESYYFDENGWAMPLSSEYTARIIVANGAINSGFLSNREINVLDEEQCDNTLKNLYKLSKFIANNHFWKAQIMQVFVSETGDLELIPRVGNHTIIFGDATKIEEKFSLLMIFYKKGLEKTGWNEYETINLKYKNQVVCTKK